MTIAEMTRYVADNLKLAGVPSPGGDRIVRLLNTAKNDLRRKLELSATDQFTARTTYSVAVGAASVDLPLGLIRLTGLTRTDGGSEVEATIIDVTQRWQYADALCGDSPVVYLEGGKIYFAGVGGAPAAMTLLLRWRGAADDLSAVDLDAEYDAFDSDACDLIVFRATADALPSANNEIARYMSLYNDGVSTHRVSNTRRNASGPTRVVWASDA